jgi:hypothetical protein
MILDSDADSDSDSDSDMETQYRALHDHEISALQQQGCKAADWSEIRVKNNFQTTQIQRVNFTGKVTLGLFTGDAELEDQVIKPSGLFDCSIHQCDIGDYVHISNVGYLTNYTIEDHVIIKDVHTIGVYRETSFGNGTEIEVLSETGGRELMIFNRLSAPLAYLIVFYRHDRMLAERLKSMIRLFVAAVRSGTGTIGAFTSIYRTGVIRHATIGSHACIKGARIIEETSLNSNEFAPVLIGEGVTLKHCIIQSGSNIVDGAFMEKCFVGQAVSIGRQFSAENSAFFANAEVALGEAGSVFAGPYTVSHHKSTLLLAGMFSFYNAGSGTNISNHMYKLGPLHQGIVERGSKTGSSSYLLWPCRIGAYNVVVGKHFSNFDTSDFPFSYLVEEKGKSVLYPAMNLFTVGTRRDSEKWPARDKRKDPDQQDWIIFDLFNPYIAGKIIRAMGLLEEYAEKTPKTQDFVAHKGAQIPRLLLKTTRKFYEMAIKLYIGQEVVRRLENETGELSMPRITTILTGNGPGTGEWRDLSGMIAPADAIEKLLEDIKKEKFRSMEALLEAIKSIHSRYREFTWNWCSAYIEKSFGEMTGAISRETLLQLITDWRINAVKLNNLMLQDAAKEFDASSRYGYGIDGDESTARLDFEAVRGNYEEHSFVKSIRTEIQNIEKRADSLIGKIPR